MTASRTVSGVFRDGAPHVEPAVATVAEGELRIEPADKAAYSPGFVLRATNEAVIWTGDLVAPIEGSTLGQKRIAGYQRAFLRLLEPVQGESGTWVIFGDGDAAFRPDDWNNLEELLRQEQLPQRDGTSSNGPPEPTGGLLTLGLLLMLIAIMGAVVALLGLPDDLAPGAMVVVVLLLAGIAIGGTLGIRRWWMEGLLVRVSRRQRQRAAIEGRAQPLQKPPPGWGTLSVFVLVGLAAGLGLLPLANEAYRSVAFPAGGALVGLLVGLVWVASIRLTPLDARSRPPRP